MDNSVSRKLSRTRKALSTALLIYQTLNEGAIIQFTKSKTSNYALKVMRGNYVILDGKKYSMNEFIEISHFFCQQLQQIIEKQKLTNDKIIVFDKFQISPISLSNSNIEHSLSSHSSFSNTSNCYKNLMNENETFENNNNNINNYNNYNDKNEKMITKERDKQNDIKQIIEQIDQQDCRNKEAAFSNFLAYQLLQKGYKLHFSTTNMKFTQKVMHFFVWNGITTPNGIYQSIKNDEPLINVVNQINLYLSKIITTDIDKSIFNHSNQSLSCFYPVTDQSLFTIVTTKNVYIHPFV